MVIQHLYYDCNLCVIHAQTARLKPAIQVVNANITPLVWGNDSLAFIHFVETGLNELQLIVADGSLHDASKSITDALPYVSSTGPDPAWCETPLFEPSQPYCFPNSIKLELDPSTSTSVDDPPKILIHPQSHFSYDVDDPKLSVTLDSFPARLRFPTLTAFLDTCIKAVLDPPLGYSHRKFNARMLIHIEHILGFTLKNDPRRILQNGDVEAEHKAVLKSLKEENQPFFEDVLRNGTCLVDLQKHINIRKGVLRGLGRHEEANRPFPRPTFDPVGSARHIARLKASRGSRSMSTRAILGGSRNLLRLL